MPVGAPDRVGPSRPSLNDALRKDAGEAEDDGDALLAALPSRGRWRAKPPEAPADG